MTENIFTFGRKGSLNRDDQVLVSVLTSEVIGYFNAVDTLSNMIATSDGGISSVTELSTKTDVISNDLNDLADEVAANHIDEVDRYRISQISALQDAIFNISSSIDNIITGDIDISSLTALTELSDDVVELTERFEAANSGYASWLNEIEDEIRQLNYLIQVLSSVNDGISVAEQIAELHRHIEGVNSYYGNLLCTDIWPRIEALENGSSGGGSGSNPEYDRKIAELSSKMAEWGSAITIKNTIRALANDMQTLQDDVVENTYEINTQLANLSANCATTVVADSTLNPQLNQLVEEKIKFYLSNYFQVIKASEFDPDDISDSKLYFIVK